MTPQSQGCFVYRDTTIGVLLRYNINAGVARVSDSAVCVNNVQYLNKQACTTQGVWTEAHCTNNEYTSKAACVTPGTWTHGNCSINAGVEKIHSVTALVILDYGHHSISTPAILTEGAEKCPSRNV